MSLIEKLDKLSQAKDVRPAPWGFLNLNPQKNSNEPSYQVVTPDHDPQKDFDYIMEDATYYNIAPSKAEAEFLVELRNAWPKIKGVLMAAKRLHPGLSQAYIDLERAWADLEGDE